MQNCSNDLINLVKKIEWPMSPIKYNILHSKKDFIENNRIMFLSFFYSSFVLQTKGLLIEEVFWNISLFSAWTPYLFNFLALANLLCNCKTDGGYAYFTVLNYLICLHISRANNLLI